MGTIEEAAEESSRQHGGAEVEAEVVVTARGAGERVEVIGVALGPPGVVVGPLGIPV
jgi:hypothetical protein